MPRGFIAIVTFAVSTAAYGIDLCRDWESRDGYHCEATIVGASDDTVMLKRSGDNRLVEVPINRLCKRDQNFVDAYSSPYSWNWGDDSLGLDKVVLGLGIDDIAGHLDANNGASSQFLIRRGTLEEQRRAREYARLELAQQRQKRNHVSSTPTLAVNVAPNPFPINTGPSIVSSGGGGGRVHVRGYYRKDGTYVRSHTRSRPRR